MNQTQWIVIMNDFTFSPKFITKSDDIIIESVIKKMKELDSFNGIGIEKIYLIKYVGSSTMRFVGKERSKGKAEEISFDDVNHTLRVLKTLSVFNSNTEILKEKFPSVMYRMRGIVFAILLDAGVIVRV